MRYIMEQVPFGTDPHRIAQIMDEAGDELRETARQLRDEVQHEVAFIDEVVGTKGSCDDVQAAAAAAFDGEEELRPNKSRLKSRL